MSKFQNGDFVIFRNYHGIIVSTDKIDHKWATLYEHILDVNGEEVLCYDYTLTYDIDRIRLEKIKKIKQKYESTRSC